MKTYRDDPWELLDLDKDQRRIRQRVMWTHDLLIVQSPSLSAVIRISVYEGGKPPSISVDFYQPGLSQQVRELSIQFSGTENSTEPTISTTTRPWKHTDTPAEKLTIRIDVEGEGQPYGSLGLTSLKKASEDHRRLWLDLARDHWKSLLREEREKKPNEGSIFWWIDPEETPIYVTRIAFLLYLAQAKMVDMTKNDFDVAKLLKPVAKRIGGSIDLGVTFQAFKRMTKHFALPQHWKALRKYLDRCIRTEASKSGENIMQSFSDDIEVPLRTAHRWKSELGQQLKLPARKVQLTEEVRTALKQRADDRVKQKAARSVLLLMGKNSDTARQFVYRHRQKGESWDEILQNISAKVQATKR